MKINVKFILLSFCIFFLGAAVRLLFLPETETLVKGSDKNWGVDTSDNIVDNVVYDYDDLLERNFYLLPKGERDKLIQDESSEEQKESPAVVLVDRTLRDNFQQFDANYQVGLVGVFNDSERYGVFQKINFETQQSTYQKVSVNESIGPYRLVKLTSNIAELYSSEQVLKLELFKLSGHSHE